MSHKKGILALSPLLVFMLVYLLSSIAAGDFYAVPVSSAFLLASAYAIVLAKGSVSERLDRFSSGVADNKLLLMIWIFVLAGVFAKTAEAMGAVDSTVSLALKAVPASMIYAGFFLTACFISMAMGTSVGTIVSLAPIATGVAQQCGSDVAYMVAIIVGGSFFGDNLSFISDTTIAASRAVDCGMNDKFKTNIRIIFPAVVAVLAIYLFQGAGVSAESVRPDSPVVWYKVMPYLGVIILAVSGTNVVVSLVAGIMMNAVIGFACGDFSWAEWLGAAGRGIAGMSDLIIVTMLAGGLLAIIRSEGGLDYLVEVFSRRIRGPRGAQLSIAAIVFLANLCTANNTIAIITTGGVAKDLGSRFGVDRRKTASLLDTFSCLAQSIIPYGAQLLMASSLASVTPVAVIPYLYYPFIMGLCALGAIAFQLPRFKEGI